MDVTRDGGDPVFSEVIPWECTEAQRHVWDAAGFMPDMELEATGELARYIAKMQWELPGILERMNAHRYR